MREMEEKELSTENHTQCPKCWDKLVDKKNKLKQRIVNEYGKTPKEEFMELVEESRLAIDATNSLMENYEIGMERNGKFSIGYKCTCVSCGFFFTFEHVEQAKIYE